MRLLATLALLLTSFSALAIPVTWNLENVVFDHGGTATGSFVYDADANTYTDIDIFYEPNVGAPPQAIGTNAESLQTWVLRTSATGFEINALLAYDQTTGYYWDNLKLQFATALTNSGGVISIVPDSWQANDLSFGLSPDIQYWNHIVSGSVSTVPVPAAFWLFISALAGLRLIRRNRAAASP